MHAGYQPEVLGGSTRDYRPESVAGPPHQQIAQQRWPAPTYHPNGTLNGNPHDGGSIAASQFAFQPLQQPFAPPTYYTHSSMPPHPTPRQSDPSRNHAEAAVADQDSTWASPLEGTDRIDGSSNHDHQWPSSQGWRGGGSEQLASRGNTRLEPSPYRGPVANDFANLPRSGDEVREPYYNFAPQLRAERSWAPGQGLKTEEDEYRTTFKGSSPRQSLAALSYAYQYPSAAGPSTSHYDAQSRAANTSPYSATAVSQHSSSYSDPSPVSPANVVQDRPYQCNQCSLGFQRNHDLKRHKRIHLDIKPFPCHSCEKRFTRKDALKRHLIVRGHVGPPPEVQTVFIDDTRVKEEGAFDKRGAEGGPSKEQEGFDGAILPLQSATSPALPANFLRRDSSLSDLAGLPTNFSRRQSATSDVPSDFASGGILRRASTTSDPSGSDADRRWSFSSIPPGALDSARGPTIYEARRPSSNVYDFASALAPSPGASSFGSSTTSASGYSGSTVASSYEQHDARRPSLGFLSTSHPQFEHYDLLQHAPEQRGAGEDHLPVNFDAYAYPPQPAY